MKNQPLIVDITSISHDGRGITHIHDKTTFVSGALPHEKVTCQLTKKNSRYNEGLALEIISPSKDRVIPACEHFGVCGGCSLQHMDTFTQIQFKEKVLLEQLKHFGQVEPENLLNAMTGEPWHYRRKARLGVKFVRKKGRVLVGFREKVSHYLADIQACSVLHESIGPYINKLSELIGTLIQYEHIPQIEVAVSDTKTALVFRHMVALPEEDIKKLCDFAKKYQFEMYLQPGSPHSIHKIWPEDAINTLSYALPDYHIEMLFHPLDFIQINAEINLLMIRQALALLEPQSDDRVLDLFCGLGNFTLPIASYAKQVTGIEGSVDMVLRASENALHNRISNAEFFATNLMEPSLNQSWMQKKYHKILLDPPRSGAQEIITFFPNFSPARIVYVSCNPATLARDAKELVHQQGYKLKTTGILNMFPHTSHIEAIALFEK